MSSAATSVSPLLRLRAKMKAHQPLFVVKETHKVSRIGRRWRANRGIHSGVRQMHRGKQAMPTPGFGTPRNVRHLHQSGLLGVVISAPSGLEKINPRTQGAVISSRVGKRKRIRLLEAIVEKKIPFLSPEEPAASLQSLRSEFAARQKAKEERASMKSKKEAEKNKKAEDRKAEENKKREDQKGEGGTSASLDDAIAEKTVEEQRKEQEQKEAEKRLIKPQ